MESLTRLVTESLARHGFDRPLDYRRLHWSQWFRCESHHSLLVVPSKPGVFAIAEEIADLAPRPGGTTENSPAFQRREAAQNKEPRPVGTPEASQALHSYPSNQSVNGQNANATAVVPAVEDRRFTAASSAQQKNTALAAAETRRLLAVTQFFDADDMAFTLDRMLTRSNPMRARLSSGRYFVRYVVIEEESQRRSISAALNQWIANQSPANQSIANAGEPSAIGAYFASSLELTEAHVGTGASQACPEPSRRVQAERSSAATWKSGASAPRPAVKDEGALAPASSAAPHLDSGAATNIHCPSPLPSGF
jgi:hypothetical protein